MKFNNFIFRPQKVNSSNKLFAIFSLTLPCQATYRPGGWEYFLIRQGFWYFTEKIRGKFAEKSANFAGFSREKSQNSREKQAISGIFPGKSQNSRRNRPILRDFRRRKVKIRRKIGRLRGILAEKSQISKDFQGQIVRKIGRCHGKFRGETSPRNNQ